MLTGKQYALLQFIDARVAKTALAPSFEEMKQHLGLRSKSGVHRLVAALEERGFIRRLCNRARAIEVLRRPKLQHKLRVAICIPVYGMTHAKFTQSLASMIVVRAASGGQIWFTGVLLCLLMLLWMRAAVIVYALFFGLLPFPGLNHVAAVLFTTPTGWALLIVGSVVGALFAAFSFAISVFSIPMMLEERVDALTAMGTSMALVWNNRPVMLTWGAIVLALFLFSLATGLLGLIVVFPVLGHGTWHAYRAIRR